MASAGLFNGKLHVQPDTPPQLSPVSLAHADPMRLVTWQALRTVCYKASINGCLSCQLPRIRMLNVGWDLLIS